MGARLADARFTLEKVACLGCCSLAPVMTIDEDTHGRLDPARASAIVDAVRSRATIGEISDALRSVWGSYRPGR